MMHDFFNPEKFQLLRYDKIVQLLVKDFIFFKFK